MEMPMQEKAFRDYCHQRKFDDVTTEAAVDAVRDLEVYATAARTTLEVLATDELSDYLGQLIQAGKNSEATLLALARYFYVIHRNELFVRLAQIIGTSDVLATLRERARMIVGDAVTLSIFSGQELPPAGSPLESYPQVTAAIVTRMEELLSPASCKQVLTGNMHQIPVESFADLKERFRANPDIDTLLADRHARLVEELEDHMKQGRIWYEQEITPEVLQLVRDDPEIQSGVRHGDLIYVSKIPFAPQAYLHENDPTMKRFYACHCPLARTSIRTGKPQVPATLCYCSAGFEKLAFDVIFDEPTHAEVLESALAGSAKCRFAITIPPAYRKGT
jgi:hypothetical protein